MFSILRGADRPTVWTWMVGTLSSIRMSLHKGDSIYQLPINGKFFEKKCETETDKSRWKTERMIPEAMDKPNKHQ